MTDYVTHKEFNNFVTNHFHTLSNTVSELQGGQRVAIIMLGALVGLVTAMVAIVAVS